ncbi:MAG: single-stranded DNA-binding protein [candidate division Zixibacteria bacterium]|nr:single-stranded DNA-binding protein [candidate division Zixibacteria bacterium]
MASVNKAIIIGNLGRDPELRYTPSGTAVANFPVATTNRYKDSSGENRESTEWHNIVLWGRQAELAKEYLSKGRAVYIEGRIQTRNYQDKDGIERWRTEIVGQMMQFLGSRSDGGSGGGGASTGSSYTPPEPPKEKDNSAFDNTVDDDDLPF